MLKRQNIAIVGAGTAGLASAIMLARLGHDITLFEQAAMMENVGAGLLLQPSGMAVFEHLGVLEHAMDLGAPVDALKGWSKKSLLVNSSYQQAGPNLIGLGMHRASLCDVLIQQLKPYNIDWYMSADVIAVHDHLDHMQLDVCLHHQPMASLNFDLVLVANGARSDLRPAAWTRMDKPYPWGAVWAIVPETTDLDYRVLHQFYHGASRMMGLLPTGATPDGKGKRLTSVFWSLPADQIDGWITAPQQFLEWKAEVDQLWPAAASWLNQSIHSTAQFMPARYRDVVMSCYGQHRLGIVGDAAHAMSPQLGQGANMALLDAWALGQAFSAEADYPSMWAHYHRLRQPSIRFYQTMSRLLTPFYQSNSRTFGLLRDVAFSAMYRLPWLPKQMATTISGIKTGALSEICLDDIRHPVEYGNQV
jgi:2-polyprenyl-6-methoxyphenol hydroxylase-like FAD-dependent oxidoreductase